MEDKYVMDKKFIFTVQCDSEEELKIYTDAMNNFSALCNIYNKARNYVKYMSPTEKNYYNMGKDIRELSGHVYD